MRYYKTFYELTVEGREYEVDSPLEAYSLVLDIYGNKAVYDFRKIAKGTYLITVILLDKMTKKVITVVCH